MSSANSNSFDRKHSLGARIQTTSNGTHHSHEQAPLFKPTSERKLFSTEVLDVKEYCYTNPLGEEKRDEGISFKRNFSANERDDIFTIAVLKRQIMCDCILLVKRYRAPLKAYTLEFPTSTVDAVDEDPGEIAKNEVQSESGYRATSVKHVSPLTAANPEVSDGKVKLVSVIVDGDDNIGNAPRANGHHPDRVQSIQVPVNGLLDRLDEYTRQGVLIDSKVYAFAIGLKKGEKIVKGEVMPDELEQL